MLVVVLALAGCGGGGEAPTAGASTNAAGAGTNATEHTLAVQTVDTSGRPVAGVSVVLNGGFDGMSRVTNADGKASFTFTTPVPAGEASLGTYSPTHHTASRRFQIDAVQGQLLQLSLLRLEQATPRVTGVTAEASTNASALSVDAVVAVTTRTGARSIR